MQFVYAALLAAVLAQAQQPGSVRGMVTSIAGEPLRKAEVLLRGVSTNQESSVMAADTDASGGFAFASIPPGNYVVTARRVGFLSAEGMPRMVSMPATKAITVAAGQATGGILIKLTPHSVISGKVTDEDGDPIFGTTVSIFEESFFRGRRTLNLRGNTNVNDLGEYRVAGLQPARYFVGIEKVDPLRLQAKRLAHGSATAFVPMYFPGVTDPASATPIQLEAGHEARGIDFRMRKMPVVNVRGRVVDPAGNAALNVSVLLLNGDSPAAAPIGRAMTNPSADGSFSFPGVASGSYVVVASSTGPEHATAVTSLQVGSTDVENVLVRMLPPAHVSGVIRAEEPIDMKNLRVTLDPIESFPPDMRSSDPIGEANRFSIQGVSPGRYRVAVFGAPDGYYAKSASLNGEDVSETGLSVTSAVTGLEIALVKGAATLRGTLAGADGKKTGGGSVAIVPAESKRGNWDLFKTVMVNQNGDFTIRNLPPGEYTLLGFGPDADATAAQNPEYFKRVQPVGKIVKLAGGAGDANATETLDLKVIN